MIKKIINILFLNILSFLYVNGYAEITIKDCNKHKISVLENINTETQMNEKEISLLSKIIMDSCINNIINTNNNIINIEDDKDWFTEKILSGNKSKKDGNKRLKNLK